MRKTKELLAELEKYENKGRFHFRINDVLSSVCNIPARKDYSGLYAFYSENKELVYVGISGREGLDRNIIHRKDGLRGRFLTGKQFGDRRSITFPIQMKLDGISILEIHWFVTYGDNAKDIPRPIERAIIEMFKMENNGKRPRWNKRD
ncbi:GIY-YIG nuclease family protein [Parasediminibacterium sp. JCM 36343]|uniref:GIY-YIG nuclease family protein n=1 Tax=Parasediminibacterium sp. JCM 36343 TaxID=3374279 RepID=UPI00397897B8